jgi:restriction system protein
MYCTVNNLEKGRLGERIVSEALTRLPSGYHHFENLILPVRIGSRETTQIDHVVVSEFGCFVIETKKIEGRIARCRQHRFYQRR